MDRNRIRQLSSLINNRARAAAKTVELSAGILDELFERSGNATPALVLLLHASRILHQTKAALDDCARHSTELFEMAKDSVPEPEEVNDAMATAAEALNAIHDAAHAAAEPDMRLVVNSEPKRRIKG